MNDDVFPEGFRLMRWRSSYGDLIAGLACVWVAAGASYFGFWSCGNYVWKSDAFRYGAVALTLVAVLFPGHRLNNLPRRMLFPVALWAAYVLLESAVAPFYPGAPATWHEYAQDFKTALSFGPCR